MILISDASGNYEFRTPEAAYQHILDLIEVEERTFRADRLNVVIWEAVAAFQKELEPLPAPTTDDVIALAVLVNEELDWEVIATVLDGAGAVQ